MFGTVSRISTPPVWADATAQPCLSALTRPDPDNAAPDNAARDSAAPSTAELDRAELDRAAPGKAAPRQPHPYETAPHETHSREADPHAARPQGPDLTAVTRPPTYTATGLPAGLSISSDGVISGSMTELGTNTVTIISTEDGDLPRSVSFDWVVL